MSVAFQEKVERVVSYYIALNKVSTVAFQEKVEREFYHIGEEKPKYRLHFKRRLKELSSFTKLQFSFKFVAFQEKVESIASSLQYLTHNPGCISREG